MPRPVLDRLPAPRDLWLAGLLVSVTPGLAGCPATATADTDTDTDTDTDPTGTTTAGDEPFCREPTSSSGDEPPVWVEPSCKMAPGDHSGAQCSSGGCPITTDIVWRCDREFTQLGLRVATGDDTSYLLSSSDDRAILLSASGQQPKLDFTLPLDFLHQTALLDRGVSGELYVAADTTRPDAGYQGGRIMLRGQPGAWTVLSTNNPVDSGQPFLISDFESSGDAVHAWFDIGLDWPFHWTYTFVNGQGGTSGAYPITPRSWNHWTLDHAGAPVSLSFAEEADGWQLGARIHESDPAQTFDIPLGDPVVACSPLAYRPTSPTKPAAPAAAVPGYSAVIQHPDSLRVVWPSQGPEPSPYDEFTVPDTALAAYACPRDEAARGLVVDGFGVAQTTDGRLWLAWVEARACEPEEDPVLHLASFDFAARTLTGHLELAIPPLAPIVRTLEPNNARMIDVRAWADRLAIGLRLRDDGGPAVARLLQIDTSKL